MTARLKGTSGEETIRVRWLVGADGGRSFVRHALDIGFPGKTLGVRAMVADVILTGLDRGVWHRFGDGDMQRQIAICRSRGRICSRSRDPSQSKARSTSPRQA